LLPPPSPPFRPPLATSSTFSFTSNTDPELDLPNLCRRRLSTRNQRRARAPPPQQLSSPISLFFSTNGADHLISLPNLQRSQHSRSPEEVSFIVSRVSLRRSFPKHLS
jgi:hypothetical protein